MKKVIVTLWCVAALAVMAGVAYAMNDLIMATHLLNGVAGTCAGLALALTVFHKG